ncbi:DNA-binding transcriptional regulator, LysR family [Variovorax sp. CF079]|uniref:LysR family transcriptional regulator n=1 Tax=Variovorax sp. CF079 TaxID=1882774 RepID=UPI00087E5F83|nr:LysR family transcriptional regulator [Variovorax sp. CF079]SDE88343.1 DNA-binding transcriptional regulator, LysR family [Variovorax sp. CF079]
MTFKQLEAFFWVATLGGFVPASEKLHTVPSAITKRIQELESQLELTLFDRTERTARLTDKGSELLAYAGRMLALRDETVLHLAGQVSGTRALRLGVTEATAMTWLSALIAEVQENLPHVRIEPDVDASVTLRDKLLADEIDLMIVPNAYDEARFISEPVGEVELVWMCKPGLVEATQPMTLAELALYPVLANRSGPGLILERWFKKTGFRAKVRTTSNSIVPLLSLACAGAGVTYVQWPTFRHLCDVGRLVRLDVKPALPPLQYAAVYKTARAGEFMTTMVTLARATCQFSDVLPLLTPSKRTARGASKR